MIYSKEEKERVEKEPCRCVICAVCDGTGQMIIDHSLDGVELDHCDYCNGGITEVCDRCQLLDDMDHDFC